MMTGMAFSEIPKCSVQKVNIVGKYGEKGEFSSPILEIWSDASGNMTAFEIRSKKSFTKSLLVLKDAENLVLKKIEIPLKKNKSIDFDLIAEVKKQITTVKKIELQLFASNNAKEFCLEESIIIEKDGQEAREVKNAKDIN
jgi:hypothetical protein